MLKATEASVQTFNSAQFGPLRTHIKGDGVILFALNDVARALEITNSRNLVQRLVKRGVHSIDTPTSNQHGAEVIQPMTYIDEPNLYRCIFQSRKKEAEKFQDWVFEEVLPAIRQNGGYVATQSDDTPEMIMARALQVAQATIDNHRQRLQIAQSTIEAQEAEIQALAPKASYTDEVLQSTSTYTLTQIAHDLGLRSVYVLTERLRALGYLYKQSGQWQPTAKVADKGYFATRTAKYIKSDGSIGSSISSVLTESGRRWLHELYGKLSCPTTALDTNTAI